MLKLTKSDEFRARLFSIVDSLKPLPKVIVCPPNSAAQKLAEIVKEHLCSGGISVETFVHRNLKIDTNLRKGDEALRSSIATLGTDEAILFMDDVFITGKRVFNYQKNVRDLRNDGPMHYIAGVSRPPTMDGWMHKKRAFSKAVAGSDLANTFASVETLLLPHWDDDHCPWCLERSILSGSMLPTERMDRLKAVTGMTERLFLKPENAPDMQLKGGSFLGPENWNPAMLFAFLSSYFQTLRTEGEPRLGDTSFMVNSVMSKEVLLSYYSDPVLTAAILRALRPEELIYANESEEREYTQKFLDLLGGEYGHEIFAEIALAHMSGKIPNIPREHEAIVEQLDANAPAHWVSG